MPESPDLKAASAAVDRTRDVVEGAARHLAGFGRIDDHQVVAYDLAHAAAAVDVAAAVIDYGHQGEVEARIAGAFVAEAVHDVATRLLGREADFGAAPGALDGAVADTRAWRAP